MKKFKALMKSWKEPKKITNTETSTEKANGLSLRNSSMQKIFMKGWQLSQPKPVMGLLTLRGNL